MRDAPSDWRRLVFVVSGGGGRGGGREGERTRTHLISPMRTHPHHLELCPATSPLASRPWRYITTIISFASVRTTPPHLPNPSLRRQRRRSQHAPLLQLHLHHMSREKEKQRVCCAATATSTRTVREVVDLHLVHACTPSRASPRRASSPASMTAAAAASGRPSGAQGSASTRPPPSSSPRT